MFKKTVIILTSSYYYDSQASFFDRPIDFLNVNGQSLIERYLLLFNSYLIIIVVEKNQEYYYQKFNAYKNVTIVSIDKVKCNKTEKLLTAFDYISKESESITIVEANSIIDYNFFVKFSTDEHSPKCIKSSQKLGFLSFPISMIDIIKKRIQTNRINQNGLGCIVDTSFKIINSQKNEYDFIHNKNDYKRVLTNGFTVLPYLRTNPYTNFFEKPMKKFVGVYDVVGAKLAQIMGFDGLWLGSYQISLSFGVEDDETYNPNLAINLCKRLNANFVTLPKIIDVGSGFASEAELESFSSYCNSDISIVGICIDDNKASRKNSMLSFNGRKILSTEEFIDRINDIKIFFRNDIYFLSRTEMLIVNGEKTNLDELKLKGQKLLNSCSDAFLPHYIGNSISFYNQIIDKMNDLHPLVSIPTGLVNLPPSFFEKQKLDIIIYANIDIRSRINLLITLFQNISLNNSNDSIQNVISADKIKDLLEKTNYIL